MRSNLALAAALTLAATSATAAPLGRIKDGAKPTPAAATAAPAAARAPHVSANAIPVVFTLPGVPAWQPPAEYSVDMVMSSGEGSVTMHRIFRNGSIRSDIAAEGENVSMIEKADEPGTTYTLMPSRKMAMKMSADDVDPALAKAADEKAAEAKPAADEKPEIEKLGSETLDGHAATKFEVSAGEHHALMWFDTATGAPLRMESEGSKIEWKNLEVKPQPAALFEVPKEYQVMDMGEMQKKMQAAMAQGGGRGMPAGMGTGAAMSALGGGMGMPGGGMSLQGAAGAYGQRMGQGMGQQIGSGIGASFGGPIGAMAGSYIGGKVGGWLGHRVATAVTPDVGPGSSK